MPLHRFSVHLRLTNPYGLGDEVLRQLTEKTPNDFNSGMSRPGVLVLDYNRDAATPTVAIRSALTDVKRVAPNVVVASIRSDSIDLAVLSDMPG